MIGLYQAYLTDGVTTLNLYEGADYALVSFAPVIAPLESSQLAAGGPYRIVQQPITLDIFGDTPTACWDNLTRLIRLIAQGDYWSNDLPVNAVRFVIQTADTAPLVETLVLGDVTNAGHVSRTGQISDSGSDLSHSIADLEPTYNSTPRGSAYVLQNVTLAFLRSGAWETAVEATVTSTTAVNPGIMLGTFASSSRTYSRIRFAGSKTAGGGATEGFVRDSNYAFLLLTSDDAKLQLIDSVSFSTGAGITNVVDTTNDAYGGSVRRFEASTTELVSNANVGGVSGWATLQRRVGIFAAVRNNSASVGFYLRGEVTDTTNTSNRTPYVPVEATTTNPQIVFLGLLTARYDQATAINVNLYVSATTTSAAHTLDVDYVTLICLDDIWSDRVLAFGTTLSASGTPSNLVIEPGSSILRTAYPLTTLTSTGFPHGTAYRGDAYLVGTGGELAALLLTTNGDNYWRIRNAATANTLGFTLRRSRAYLTPPGVTEP
jgi:hypothetical protein